eukprot:CAMPEP_0172435542 /NCGR_PEP_ID=MMETSP1064-20121228/71234_1 /TAXON_ID=202472 /ORGANISM="Aulacoseira subarctica , Strain CCAP 1002/5" /LENGTH=572 /DNA_ID=CAMNT_0013183871 /DNA_START=364 /DNA_END=2083 /DNA_ORIENTATION=-
MQDTLVEVIKSVSIWAVAARKAGATEEDMNEANKWSLSATFSTLTNVNFSETRIAEYAHQGMQIQRSLQELVRSKQGVLPEASEVSELNLSPNMSVRELEEFGRTVGVLERAAKMKDDDSFSLNELATYGAKGVSAYACHALEIGKMDELGIMAPLHEVWTKLASNSPDLDGLLATALKVGEINAKTMALLDSAHCEVLGTPQPTPVRMTAVEGKAILITGHDMMDCQALLEQTEGKGINVYTHGEMLPASSYPGLKKFKHLVGNYGTAWQAQKFEFATFPGPILVTSNCVVEPRKSYKDRLYTVNEVGLDGVQCWNERRNVVEILTILVTSNCVVEPRKSYKDRLYTVNEVGLDGVQHVVNRDFSKLIDQAIHMEGFKKTVEPARYHTVGFNHRAVLPLASQVIESVQKGQLSRIFVIGGCDGSELERSYYTDLAEETPQDSIILTLGCAKNRIIHSSKLQGATLSNGIPRVMDMGQCNDAYSAVVVALELAKALNCSVNDLPLSMALSHLEQKAAAVLLTLLHLGVENIRLGPHLPAYITPNILKILQEKYNLMPTGESEKDLKLMMQGS